LSSIFKEIEVVFQLFFSLLDQHFLLNELFPTLNHAIKKVTLCCHINEKQAEDELCQAQEKLGLARNCGHLPVIQNVMLFSICLKIEVVFH
jgi:hypothetical protein